MVKKTINIQRRPRCSKATQDIDALRSRAEELVKKNKFVAAAQEIAEPQDDDDETPVTVPNQGCLDFDLGGLLANLKPLSSETFVNLLGGRSNIINKLGGLVNTLLEELEARTNYGNYDDDDDLELNDETGEHFSDIVYEDEELEDDDMLDVEPDVEPGDEALIYKDAPDAEENGDAFAYTIRTSDDAVSTTLDDDDIQGPGPSCASYDREPTEVLENTIPNHRTYNIGESDYSQHRIQPWDIWREYDLNPWDADIVKRVLRKTGATSRADDYRKIIHVCLERLSQLGETM